jgi:allantoate deiminase
MNKKNADSAGPQTLSLGEEIVGRINQLAAISETPQHLARIFLTREHRAAAELIMRISMRSATSAAATKAIGPICRA